MTATNDEEEVMRTTMKGCRWILALTALTALVVVPANAEDMKLWRHGIVEAKSDAGIVFMGSKGGFAEKQGLKIEIMQFKGDTLALKALLAGELDSYEGNPGSPMVAASRGADIKLLGCYWPGLTYAIYSKAGINSPADLKGKTFAISAPGALPDLVARAVLAQNNVPAADVKFTVMGSDADRFKAVTAGIVDAAAASSGFAPAAEKAGVKMLVHAIEAVPNYVRFCIYSSGKTLAARKDDAARFLAAEMAGFRHALANRDQTIAADARDHACQTGQSAARFHLRRSETIFGRRSGYADPDEQARLAARSAGDDGQPHQASRSRRICRCRCQNEGAANRQVAVKRGQVR